jgi:LysM repeat protein
MIRLHYWLAALFLGLALTLALVSPTQAQGNTYTVQTGDTLTAIAARYNTTPEQLMALNGLSTDMIYIGQVLKVSGAPAPSGSAGTHTVQVGETLFSIAVRYNTSVETIKAWNRLASDIIYVGQVLKVSGAAVPAPVAPPSNSTRHMVAVGDTLTGIAFRYNSTVDAIKSANGLVNDFIYVGQTLAIPGRTGGTTTPLAPQPPVYYYVQGGDSLGRIADIHGVSVGALAQLNNLKVTDWVYTGQRLLIPSGIYTPAAPAAPPTRPNPAPTPRPQPTRTPAPAAPPYVPPGNTAPPAPPANTAPAVTRVWVAEITQNNCSTRDTLEVRSVVRITVEGKVGQGIDLYAKPKMPSNYLTYVVSGTKPELGPYGAEIAPLRAGNYVLSAPGLADIGFYVDGACSISVNFKQVNR